MPRLKTVSLQIATNNNRNVTPVTVPVYEVKVLRNLHEGAAGGVVTVVGEGHINVPADFDPAGAWVRLQAKYSGRDQRAALFAAIPTEEYLAERFASYIEDDEPDGETEKKAPRERKPRAGAQSPKGDTAPDGESAAGDGASAPPA